METSKENLYNDVGPKGSRNVTASGQGSGLKILRPALSWSWETLAQLLGHAYK